MGGQKRRAPDQASKLKSAKHSSATGPSRPPVAASSPATLSIEGLPDSALQNILAQLGFPHRFNAARVCRRWRQASNSPFFSRTVTKKSSITATIAAARPGDTVFVPAGFYQEVVFVDKPLRLVGHLSDDIWGGKRRGTVFQNSRSVVVLCNARCCIQNLVMRTTAPLKIRSICCYGPKCDLIWLQNCEIGGFIGLVLPVTKAPETKLVVKGCTIHGVPAMPAVAVETGTLHMEGCTVTNCAIGIAVEEAATVHIANNDLSFNQIAVTMHGKGVVRDNIIWGNLGKPVEFPEGVESCPSCCALLAEPEAAPAHVSPHPGTALPPAGVGTSAALDTAVGAPAALSSPQPAEATAPATSIASNAQASASSNGTVTGKAICVAGDVAAAEHASAVAQAQAGPSSCGAAVRVLGNHVKRPDRNGPHVDRETRRQVRRLIKEVYGNQQDWDDWHVVDDSDFESDMSDDEDDSIASSDVESDDDDDDDDLSDDDSSADDDDDDSGLDDDDDSDVGLNSDDDAELLLQHQINLLQAAAEVDSDDVSSASE